MLRKRAVVACMLLCMLAPAAAQALQDAPRAALVRSMVREINRQRALNGLRAVVLDSRLSEAAQKHAEDMARRDYVDHKSPDGRDVTDRVQTAGYAWRVVAENLSAGPSSPVSVVNSWMTSPGHRGNMLNDEVVDVGIGFAEAAAEPGARRPRYAYYWTAVFAAPSR